MNRTVAAIAAAILLSAAASNAARSQGTDGRDFLIWQKNLGVAPAKGGGSAQPKGGGSFGAPAGRGIPVIEGGGSLKQPCGMGHLGCLDGDPPSGKGFNPKK